MVATHLSFTPIFFFVCVVLCTLCMSPRHLTISPRIVCNDDDIDDVINNATWMTESKIYIKPRCLTAFPLSLYPTTTTHFFVFYFFQLFYNNNSNGLQSHHERFARQQHHQLLGPSCLLLWILPLLRR